MNPKQRGAAGEREACKWLEQHLFGKVGLERNLNQTRSGGADIIYHPFCFEVKRRAAAERILGYHNWWSQVCRATRSENIDFGAETFTPVVMFRIDKRDWQFLIPATLIGCQQGWIHVDAVRFKEWAKQFANLE
jgi:hypothetical protein